MSRGRDVARAEAMRHIQEHSLGEAARIGRLSRIREFVLGTQDGLLVPLGVVTGMAAAHPARSLIIVAGLAEAVAGAISMGGGEGTLLCARVSRRLTVLNRTNCRRGSFSTSILLHC